MCICNRLLVGIVAVVVEVFFITRRESKAIEDVRESEESRWGDDERVDHKKIRQICVDEDVEIDTKNDGDDNCRDESRNKVAVVSLIRIDQMMEKDGRNT